MRCGCLSAEDCALIVWAPTLGGRRERAGIRAACPVCGSDRALEFDVPNKSVRWKTWCGCPKPAVREKLAGILGDHLGGRSARRPPIEPRELTALALAEMPPTSRRLAMLEMAGHGTAEALDRLGVRRENRGRVIADRIRTDAKPQVTPRSSAHQN